jgi:hypothetical protein
MRRAQRSSQMFGGRVSSTINSPGLVPTGHCAMTAHAIA